jgi:Cu2+-exporting ATPase
MMASAAIAAHPRLSSPEVDAKAEAEAEAEAFDQSGPTGATAPGQTCPHCGQPSFGFCCPGCQAAYALIHTMGLGGYYARRLLDPAQRILKPDPEHDADMTRHVATAPDGLHSLTLAVDGLQCAACVWLIEAVLARQPDLLSGRLNASTRRLRLTWRGAAGQSVMFCRAVEQLGYRLVPFDPATVADADDATCRALVRALAVAGFAAGNVMLISLGTWFGATQNMGPATRGLMHWVSALIALPAVAYAGRVFFRSAWQAVRHGRTNMDVPISIGVLCVTAMSLWQTIAGGPHVYFDGAVTLLFFLLLGRVLDHRARGQARATAAQLLLLRVADVAVLQDDGPVLRMRQDAVQPGMRVLVSMGERVGVDGVLEIAASSLDTSLVTGESLPVALQAGAPVFAGSINLGPAFTLRVTATGDATLLAECVRLIEAAEQARGRVVVLADRIARLYAPAVHISAAATFVAWFGLLHRGFEPSLLAACAVLIVTCPCALALAVPAVQVVMTSRLMRSGILLKSPTALERLAAVDMVVFDKTGTLTAPSLRLVGCAPARALAEAAAIAANSRHPLCRALLRGAPITLPAEGVVEHAGRGLARMTNTGEIRLGSRAFCGVAGAGEAAELCLTKPGAPPVIFRFDEELRPGAVATAAALRRAGVQVRIASGDNRLSVARVAATLGVASWQAELSPVGKASLISNLRAQGHNVLMVGDGLNDGPCLAGATVSAAPASAADISQTTADVVFQGESIAPVMQILRQAWRARTATRQNIAFAIAYNATMIPLAGCGYVTPWLAALAMSGSSIIVMLNALRLQRGTL